MVKMEKVEMKKETIFVKNRNGLKMSVRITIPDKITKLAFIEHGLSGDKDENHILILEDELSKRGYVVVNLDAIDSLNASETSQDGITFTKHYNDLEDVIEWGREQSWFQEPFALVGHSMGAASVLLYAQNYPSRVNFLMPLSFPWLSGKSRNAQHDPKEMLEWKEKGYADKISKSRGRVLRIPYNFVEDLMRYDFGVNVGKITARTVLMIGDQENKIRLDDNQKLFEMMSCEKELIILPNIPHVVAKIPENAKIFAEALAKILPS